MSSTTSGLTLLSQGMKIPGTLKSHDTNQPTLNDNDKINIEHSKTNCMNHILNNSSNELVVKNSNSVNDNITGNNSKNNVDENDTVLGSADIDTVVGTLTQKARSNVPVPEISNISCSNGTHIIPHRIISADRNSDTVTNNSKIINVHNSTPWTSEEDEMILRIRKSKSRGWAPEVKKILQNRSLYAIHSRWKRSLRHRQLDNEVCDDDGNIRKVGKWSSEEDETLVREHSKDPDRWVVSAMKYLPHRSRDAIRGRWRDIVVFKEAGAAQVTSKEPWMESEDLIIISEYDKEPRTYMERCVVALPTRTVRAIRTRWNTVLKPRYQLMVQETTNSKTSSSSATNLPNVTLQQSTLYN